MLWSLKNNIKVRKREIDFIKEKHDEQLMPATISQLNQNQTGLTNDLTMASSSASRAILGNDFKRGIADAQRARKMLLASFST